MGSHESECGLVPGWFENVNEPSGSTEGTAILSVLNLKERRTSAVGVFPVALTFIPSCVQITHTHTHKRAFKNKVHRTENKLKRTKKTHGLSGSSPVRIP